MPKTVITSADLGDISLRDYMESRFVAAELATQLALSAAEKAREKAELSTENRLTLLNELRSGVATAEQLNNVIERINEVKDRVSRIEAQGAGRGDSWKYIISAIGALFTILAIASLIISLSR
jgi:uncharacterized protein YlxW (UPF0749 family)